jgi:UrcA family protein
VSVALRHRELDNIYKNQVFIPTGTASALSDGIGNRAGLVRRQKMRRLSPLALAAALVATSGTVMFASPTQAAAIGVHYGDLDLSTPAGKAAVDARINRAARIACYLDGADAMAAHACRRDSSQRAHVALDFALHANAVQLASR